MYIPCVNKTSQFYWCMSNQKRDNFSLLKRLLKEAKSYRFYLIIAGTLAVLSAPLAALRPRLIQSMVDDYIIKYDLAGLQKMTLIIIGLLVIESLVRYAFTYLTNWIGQSVVMDLRTKVFNHITNFRMKYFDTTPIGTSTTRTINDIQTINTVFTNGGIAIIADVLIVVVVLILMISINWKLSAVCLSTIPILIGASIIFKNKVKSAFQKVRTQISKMNAFLQERITGMTIVQAFNAEEKGAKKFKAINRDYTQANLDTIFYYAIFFPVVEILSAASLGLMVWFGAKEVINEDLSLGVLVAFPLYLNMLFRPIRTLADKFNTLQMGLVASERVFTVLDREEQISNEGISAPDVFKGEIKFKDVSFAYKNTDWVLKNISFDLKENETLAIVGSTGSGKSTIINLLNRFYEIQKGEILVNNQNIKDYPLTYLREKLAIVLQDVFLFGGSVLENITLANPNITKEQVIAASKMIGAHDFISKLPGQYEYIVHERGSTLSMGQRQLISFVRALVFNPAILVLDEATSSIDPETEAIIQNAIEKLIDKRTSIVIAHRLATIKHADKVLVLEHGKIVEFGTLNELLQIESGVFKKLWEMQFIASQG